MLALGPGLSQRQRDDLFHECRKGGLGEFAGEDPAPTLHCLRLDVRRHHPDMEPEMGEAVLDLARKMPRNSAYYYDYLHYTEAGAAEVAEIIYRDLRPFMTERFKTK